MLTPDLHTAGTKPNNDLRPHPPWAIYWADNAKHVARRLLVARTLDEDMEKSERLNKGIAHYLASNRMDEKIQDIQLQTAGARQKHQEALRRIAFQDKEITIAKAAINEEARSREEEEEEEKARKRDEEIDEDLMKLQELGLEEDKHDAAYVEAREAFLRWPSGAVTWAIFHLRAPQYHNQMAGTTAEYKLDLSWTKTCLSNVDPMPVA